MSRGRPTVRPAPRGGRRPSAGIDDDWMTLGLGVFAIALVLNLAVWLAGQLAAVLFAGGWPTASPSDVYLFAVFRHPGDPGVAWPADGPRPGPVAFWTVAVLLIVLLFSLGWRLFDLYEHRSRRHAPGDRRSWATSGDLADLYVADPHRPAPWWLPTRFWPERSHRLILGRFRRRLIAVEGVQGACILGPTRSQKTVGFIITTLLERLYGPVVTTSVKPDVLRATIQYRRKLGKTWVYDPKESTGLPTAHWSPLSACLKYEGAKEMALALVSAAQLEAGGRQGGKFWDLKASQLIAPVL